MGTKFPRWVKLLGQWMLCGLAGALLCLVAALVFIGLDCPPALWALPLFGLQWGLVGGVALGAVLRPFGGASRDVRPGELLRIAIAMCVVVVAAAAGSECLPCRWLPAAPNASWPFLSMYLTTYHLAPLGALGGAVVGGALWGWQGLPRQAAAWRAGVSTLMALAAGYLVWPGWSPLFADVREAPRQTSCHTTLESLGLAVSEYAEDWDGRLPPCKTANGLPGIDYAKLADMREREGRLGESKAVLGGGAIWPYLKSAGLFFCPSDPSNLNWQGRPILDRFPEPGIGYTWNAKWAGKKLTSVPKDEWLLRDREPWHSGGWNVAYRGGHVRWEGEEARQ